MPHSIFVEQAKQLRAVGRNVSVDLLARGLAGKFDVRVFVDFFAVRAGPELALVVHAAGVLQAGEVRGVVPGHRPASMSAAMRYRYSASAIDVL